MKMQMGREGERLSLLEKCNIYGCLGSIKERAWERVQEKGKTRLERRVQREGGSPFVF
jgi:hypothetical protein